LDFANAGSVNANILYNGLATPGTTNELQLGGGRFEVVGAAGEANTQAFVDVQFAYGYSEFHVAEGTGGTVGVTLGTYVRDSGAVVNFTDLSASATVATTTGTANTILTNTTGQAFATVNGVDWAAKDAANTNIVAGSSIAGFYTANLANDLGGTTTNADIAGIDTTVTADETVASMRFNAAEARTITISGAGVELNTGGILVTSNVSANDIIITGTTATSLLRSVNSGSTDFPIIQNNTQGDLIVSAVIANNGGTDAITKSGDGRVILTGTNTYTGVTRVVGGALSISSNANLGAVATGAALVLDGGTLEVTANVALDNAGANIRAVNLGDKGGTFNVTASNTLTVSGVIDRDGTDTSINGLTKAGTGTLLLRGVNTYSGATTVTGGVLQVGDDASTTAITGNNSTRNDLTVQSGGIVSGTGTIAGAGATTVHTFQSGAQLRPGSITSTVGDGEATLTFNGVLSLAAGSTTTLTLASATGNVAAGPGDWVANLVTTNPDLLTGAITLGTHDHLEISHELRLTSTGVIVIDSGAGGSTYDFGNPTAGDIFNLFDWATVSIDTFNKGARYQDGTETGQDLDLPTLGAGLQWDTSLFLTHGTLVVVAAIPEPSRALLLLVGAGLTLLRRRR
jgi:fibronectin-binding autotransporter adhesin